MRFMVLLPSPWTIQVSMREVSDLYTQQYLRELTQGPCKHRHSAEFQLNSWDSGCDMFRINGSKIHERGIHGYFKKYYKGSQELQRFQR